MIHRLGPAEPIQEKPIMPTLPPVEMPATKALVSLEYWPNLIMRIVLAVGFGALFLSVIFALIYTFLRWVL